MRLWLLFCAATLGAHELRIDLSGDWRFQGAQDRPEFAQVDFDDQAWGSYRVPRAMSHPGLGSGVPPGVFWLRKTVQVPAEPRPQMLALTLGELHETYEVFVNGQSVGRTAQPGDLWTVQAARPRTFRFRYSGSDRLVIAVRAYQDERLGGNRLGGVHLSLTQHPDPGPYLLTSAEGSPAEVEKLGHQRRLSAATPAVVEAGASALLAFLILLLSLNARESGELRVLAYLLASLALLRASQYGVLLVDGPKAAMFHGPALSAASTCLLAWFVLSVSGLQKSWLRQLVAWCAAFAIPARLSALLPPTGIETASNLALAALSSGIALVGIAGVRRAVREEGWTGSRTWLNLIGLLLVLVDYQRTPSLRLIAPYWNAYGLVGDVFDIIVLGLSIAATWTIIRRLGADRRERQRLASELEAARIVQQLLLPSTGTAGVDAVYLPANEVGGDFWHFSEGRLLVAGDVSGKGLKAAMVVSLITGMLDRRHVDSPAALLTELNRALCARLEGGFVTCCVVRLEPDGQLTAANAGHPAPYLDGHELDLSPGLPLGVVPEAEYTETTFSFAGQLTLVSDGVIEAANAPGELFGFDRTRAISTQSAQEIAEAAKQWGQNDDITVVTVRRNA